MSADTDWSEYGVKYAGPFLDWILERYPGKNLTGVQIGIAEHYLMLKSKRPKTPPIMIVSYGYLAGQKTIGALLDEYWSEQEKP